MHQGIPLPDMKNIARVLIRISNNQTVCELLVDFIVKSVSLVANILCYICVKLPENHPHQDSRRNKQDLLIERIKLYLSYK